MTVALSSLRVTADMDSSGYARGAEAIASANARMAASGQLAGAALAQADATAGRTGGTLVSLSKSYIDGYSSVARFSQQVAQLQNQMEIGNTSAARAALTYTGLVNKFNLYADATKIAAGGNRDFAAVIDQVNSKAAIQIEILARAATAQKNLAQAQQTQGGINSRLGIGQGTLSARDSASVFQAQFAAQDAETARLRAAQAGAAFSDELDGRLIAGTGKAARDSASVFQEEMGKLDQIAHLRALQTGQAFSDDLNSRMIAGVAKSAKDAAAVFQEQFDQLDQIAKLKAQQVAETTQQGLSDSFGMGNTSKSAQASAAVFQAADQQAKAIDNLKTKYLPLYGIQQQYLAQLGEIRSAGPEVFKTESDRAGAIQRTKDAFAAQVVATKSATEATSGFGGAAGLGSTQAMALFAALRHMFDATAAGIPVSRVLLMEMGNLSYGLSGAGGIMGALSAVFQKAWSYVTPLTAAFAAMAVTVGTAVTALISFQNAQTNVDRLLSGAGRASGASTGDINAISQTQANGLSIAAARDLGAALASTGKVGVESIGRIVSLGHDFEKVYGINGPAAADLLAKAFADPVKGADELNQRLGFLDARTKLLIDSLVAQGNRQQAVNVLTEAMAPSIAKASDVTSGWARAWDSLARNVSNAYNNIGQAIDRGLGGAGGKSIAQQIQDLQAARAALQATQSSPTFAGISVDPNGALGKTIGLSAQQDIDALNVKIGELTAKMDAFNAAAGDARLKQRSLEIDGLARAMLPGIEAHRKAEDAVKSLSEAFANPALQKYVSLVGVDLVQALARLQGAEQAAAGADPIKNQIAGMQAQVKALDDRTIATRAAQAAAAEARNQSLDPNAGSQEERAQKQALAAKIAAGGQTALDSTERQRISTLGQLASVDDVVHAKQLELNNLARDGITFTDAQTKSILAMTRAQEEGTRLQEKVTLGIATELELRQQLGREQAAFVSRSRTTPLTEQDLATYRIAAQKKYESQSDQNSIAGSQLPQLKQMELDSASLRKELDTLSTTSLNNVTSNLADIATGAVTASAGFKNLGLQVIRSLDEMLIKMLIVAPIAKGLQSVFGGFLGGTGTVANGGITLGTPLGPTPFNANGNAFDGSNVIPFARGGAFTNSIVNMPTPFRFANGGALANGVMGEAGPEAIVPLKRGSDGKLGIASSSGGGAVISFGDIHISVPEGTNPTDAAAIARSVKQTMVQVAQEQIFLATRQRGALNRAA